MLISILPSGLLSKNTFRKDEKELIQNISYIYNIDTEEIQLMTNIILIKHYLEKMQEIIINLKIMENFHHLFIKNNQNI